MIIMIDNYDSFTYNLYQYIGTINPDIEVYRNDKITVDAVLAKNPSHIILSPGPGFPKDAGICVDLIKAAENIPILGVCLGHQSIGEAFGGRIVHAPRIMHGKRDYVTVNMDCPVFKGLGKTVEAGRYHSLVIEEESLPACLEITARSDDGCIMGVKHRDRPVFGIQFHPESVLTPNGMKMIENFLEI
ncbi:MAG: aminodeoxychorismate/anthranilate synthase component II [Oscillospiraceae bacterium]|nr:aminodeoxychorismate/anthranilate synthase component II [Oscillospiraceae bacterium]